MQQPRLQQRFQTVLSGLSKPAGACSLVLKTTAGLNELLANKIPQGLQQASAQGFPTSNLHVFDRPAIFTALLLQPLLAGGKGKEN